MRVDEVLSLAASSQVELRARAGKLVVRGRAEAVSPLLPTLREHKPLLLARLAAMAETDRREHWQERAAILEFDGGYSRDAAEAMATKELGYTVH